MMRAACRRLHALPPIPGGVTGSAPLRLPAASPRSGNCIRRQGPRTGATHELPKSIRAQIGSHQPARIGAPPPPHHPPPGGGVPVPPTLTISQRPNSLHNPHQTHPTTSTQTPEAILPPSKPPKQPPEKAPTRPNTSLTATPSPGHTCRGRPQETTGAAALRPSKPGRHLALQSPHKQRASTTVRPASYADQTAAPGTHLTPARALA